MKIAITGGSGFVGRNLVQDIAYETHPLSRSGLGDFENIKDWTPHFEGYDAVIHLAARVHKIAERVQNWNEYHDANTMLTKNILCGADRAGVKTFILLSTAAVYGAGGEQAFSEDSPKRPVTAYGKSKLLAEEHVQEHGGDMRPVIIRAPMIYGSGCRANFISLAKAVKFYLPLPLAGVKNRRSFLYVRNLSSFVTHALHNEIVSGVYNLTDGEDISTPELVRRMAAAMGKPALLYPFPPGLIRRAASVAGCQRQAEGLLGSFRLAISKAEKTGWKPAHSLDEGLKRSLSAL